MWPNLCTLSIGMFTTTSEVFLLTHFTNQIEINVCYKKNHGPNAPNSCIETLPPGTQTLANYAWVFKEGIKLQWNHYGEF